MSRVLILLLIMAACLAVPGSAQARVSPPSPTLIPGEKCMGTKGYYLYNLCSNRFLRAVYYKTDRQICAVFNDYRLGVEDVDVVFNPGRRPTMDGVPVKSLSFVDTDGNAYVRRYGPQGEARTPKCAAMLPAETKKQTLGENALRFAIVLFLISLVFGGVVFFTMTCEQRRRF